MPVEGQVLGGKYRLERLVGSGGFASVWAARNVMLDRLVALKILSENYARMPGFLPRFLREAKLASRAIHKTIVAVEDIDQTPDGLVYLVMELLEGQTLADELKGGKSLALDRTLEIISPTLEGLAAAHVINIIHRDIKPANIFLTKEGSAGPRVRILDLGLAKDLLHDDELTSTDQMVGTPSYLAPEMFLGPQTRRWAPAADVFACGMLTFRMLAGGLPFDRSVAKLTPIEQFLARAEFYQSIGQMPGPKQYVPSVPEAIDTVVRKAICLDVRERYVNAGAMLEALKEADTSLVFILSSNHDSTVDEHEEVTEMELEPESEELSGEFGDVETKVDAAPYGAEGADGQKVESSFEESLATNPIDAVPHHLQPVAGRTISPDQERPLSAGRSVPQTMPPSIEKRGTGAHATNEQRQGHSYPSYPVMSPSSPPGTGELSGAHPSHSPPPSRPDYASPVAQDLGGGKPSQPDGLGTPSTKAVEPFALSSLSDPSSATGQHTPAPIPENQEDSSPREDYVPPTHRQRRPKPSSPAAPSSLPRRRSPLRIVGIVLVIILLVLGLVVGGLFVSWHLKWWGRNSERNGDSGRSGQTDPDSTRQQGRNRGEAGGDQDQQQAGLEEISLEIHSQPPGAAVILDGQRVGTTPYQTSMHRSGEERQLTLRADGFTPIEQVVQSNESQRLEFELQPAEQ